MGERQVKRIERRIGRKVAKGKVAKADKLKSKLVRVKAKAKAPPRKLLPRKPTPKTPTPAEPTSSPAPTTIPELTPEEEEVVEPSSEPVEPNEPDEASDMPPASEEPAPPSHTTLDWLSIAADVADVIELVAMINAALARDGEPERIEVQPGTDGSNTYVWVKPVLVRMVTQSECRVFCLP